MSTTQDPKTKSNDNKSGTQNPYELNHAGEMLARKDFGATICGRLDAIDDPQHITGTNEGGPYSKHVQKITLACGGKSYNVSIKSDQPFKHPFQPQDLDKIVRLPVSIGVYKGNQFINLNI